MTLQQLRYVVTIAEIGTISKAAEELFVSQPSLTKALKELEKEMQITIFDRTNKGIHVSREGEIFLGYARQVLEQAALIEEKYKHKSGGKQEFCISTQHYSFAVNAFVDLIKEYGSENYDFSLRETQTYEIIDDVARMKSEIGILYLNEFNASVLEKIMKANDLKFTELFVARPHIFICDKNPLAQKDQVTMEASFKDDLKVDSLDLFEMVMSLEDEFDVEIPTEELEKMVTVGDVVKYIEEHK